MQDAQIDEMQRYRVVFLQTVAPERDKLKQKVPLLATKIWKLLSHYFGSVVSNVASELNVNGTTACRAASPTRDKLFAEGNVTN